MPLQIQSAIFQIHYNSPYKKEMYNPFNKRPSDFNFLASFVKY